MSIFSDSFKTIQDGIVAMAGETVIYRRDEIEVDITAVPGRPNSRIDGPEIAVGQYKDWIVERSGLGSLFPPERTDEIECSNGETFTVVELNGEDCWRDSDNNGIHIRIHTNRKISRVE